MPTAPASLIPALRRVIAGRAADAADADLLAAFVADRDPEAFAALVRRHGPMVLGVCRRVVRDPDAADDAFQAVFLVLARRADAVRPRAAVGGWLYGVAYRTALKARAVRARRRTRETQVDAMPDPAAPPAPDTWDDLKPILDEELARLPDRLRVPVVLCDLEGRPQRAVAGQLGIAPATLAGRLADARRTLAARLTRRGVAISAPALAAVLTERAAAAVVGPGLAAGVVQAAGVVAAGGAATGLVSDSALQLCDGVMRMIFLTKLKAAAAAAVAVLVVAGGVGPGLVPVRADAGAAAAVAADAPKASADADFLDRICLDLRGSKATRVEHTYFAADADAGKRRKVTGWLLAEPVALKADIRDVTIEYKTEAGWTTTAPHALTVAVDQDVSYPAVVDPLGGDADPPVFFGLAESFADFLLAKKAEGVRVQARVVGKEQPLEKVQGKIVIVVDDGTGPKAHTFTLPADAAKALELVQGKLKALTPGEKAGGTVAWLKAHATDKDKAAAGKAAAGDTFRLLVPAPGKTAEGVQLLELYLKSGDDNRREAVKRDLFLWAADAKKHEGGDATIKMWATAAAGKETDAAFLKRAVTDARGTPPTALEERYFAADPDPKKREKLLDALLADPTALRRVGAAWKQRMLAPPTALGLPVAPPAAEKTYKRVTELYQKVVPADGGYKVVPMTVERVVPVPPVPVVTPTPKTVTPPAPPTPPAVRVIPLTPVPPAPPAPPAKVVPPAAKAVAPPMVKAGDVRVTKTAAADKWGRLVAELVAAKLTDEQILEAVTVAAAGRRPTDVEKRLALAMLAASTDRAAGWAAVARALAGPPAPPPAPPRPQYQD